MVTSLVIGRVTAYRTCTYYLFCFLYLSFFLYLHYSIFYNNFNSFLTFLLISFIRIFEICSILNWYNVCFSVVMFTWYGSMGGWFPTVPRSAAAAQPYLVHNPTYPKIPLRHLSEHGFIAQSQPFSAISLTHVTTPTTISYINPKISSIYHHKTTFHLRHGHPYTLSLIINTP